MSYRGDAILAREGGTSESGRKRKQRKRTKKKKKRAY
jgi:hypothetical protein